MKVRLICPFKRGSRGEDGEYLRPKDVSNCISQGVLCPVGNYQHPQLDVLQRRDSCGVHSRPSNQQPSNGQQVSFDRTLTSRSKTYNFVACHLSLLGIRKHYQQVISPAAGPIPQGSQHRGVVFMRVPSLPVWLSVQRGNIWAA